MKRYAAAFAYLLSSITVSGQAKAMPVSFEFINQSVNDILYVFSTYAQVSIIADNTVSGNVTFQYGGENFDKAFDAFLMINRLYVEKTSELWLVSKIRIETAGNRIMLDAYDATPSQMLEKLSLKTNSTILRDILPSVPLSIHIENESIKEVAELIMKPFGDYMVAAEGSYIHVQKKPETQYTPGMPSMGDIRITESGGLFNVTIEQARIGDVIDRLFFTAKREYASFIPPDNVIRRLNFSGKIFDEALTLILEQGGGEYSEINNFCYLFPVAQAEVIRRLRDEGKAWRRFGLKYITLEECLPLVQGRFQGYQTITFTGRQDFLIFADESSAIEIQQYVTSIDLPKTSRPVRLKYIRTEDLFKALPPSVRREELIDAGNGNTVFFTGSPERMKVFIEDMAYIDRPQTRIRYDLLILQFQKASNLVYGIPFEFRPVKPGDMTMMTGELGSLLNLNFDVITVFGYQFATKLNLALLENEANVFADTTLFGLSGQEIQFQNTSTYRYRDSNIDPETAKPIYSGVTREIVSGLMLKINGWVSGDGMITTTVSASVSKQGADVSSTVGNPPPTSEKVLTTQVRGRSGETVILSGLNQNDTTILEDGLPLISKIPLLGALFKRKDTTREQTQMVIYLVPHVDLSNDEYTVEGRKTASAYERFVEPFWGKTP
jgi:type II secretory pathway component GspD/PulD (secretin)